MTRISSQTADFRAGAQSALRELRALLRRPEVSGGLLLLSLAAAVAGPFGTYAALPFIARLPYWAAIVGFSFLAGVVLPALVRAAGLPRPVAMIADVLLVGLSIAVFVWALNLAVWRGGNDNLPPFYGYLAMTLPIALLVEVAAGWLRRRDAGEAPVPPARDCPFFERLPAELGRDILHVSVQDHYVEAITDRGRHLVLMRFADALRELAALDGRRIHRSHWVSRAAAAELVRKNGRMLLRLKDGAMLPVSRPYVAEVRRWLARRVEETPDFGDSRR